MVWAAQNDITDRYGSNYLDWIADRDHDGGLDQTAVDIALKDATAEASGYVGQKYDLTGNVEDNDLAIAGLDVLPRQLVKAVVDIAAYNLAGYDAGALSDEHSKRYENAIKWLKQVAMGKVSLGVAEPPATVGASTQLNSFTRAMDRDQTEGLI